MMDAAMILAGAKERLLEAINVTPGTKMGTEEFSHLLGNYSQLQYAIAAEQRSETCQSCTCDGNAPVNQVPAEEKVAADAPEPQTETAVEEPKTKATAVTEEPEVYMSKEEVRDKLGILGNKGVDIAAIFAEMGYAKLSSVPPEKYADLLQRARAAAAGA